ncbi:MAG: FUN14 domain-containing protein [Candidatus Bathyarchaeales archaeon]
MSEILYPIIYQLGIGGIGGFIMGFALKKISKLLLVLIGIFIIALIYLGAKGIISINYEALFTAIGNLLGMAGSAFSWLIHVIALIPFAGSFIVGFVIGFKLG